MPSKKLLEVIDQSYRIQNQHTKSVVFLYTNNLSEIEIKETIPFIKASKNT